MLAAWILAGALAGGAAPGAAAVPATPVFRSYGVAEGLPSTLVYSVTQDHTGYIWIGTHAGLVRYDSRTFRVFRHEPGKAVRCPRTTSPRCWSIMRDGCGWAAKAPG